MQKFVFIILALAVITLGAGCGKKQKSLEEMQEPMSMESLNTLKAEGTAGAGSSTQAVSSGAPLEPLPPSGPYQPTPVEIQTALQNSGYYTGAIDGKIGPKTLKAIEEFQKANGLMADGKVGRKTWALLSKHLNAPSAAPTPDN